MVLTMLASRHTQLLLPRCRARILAAFSTDIKSGKTLQFQDQLPPLPLPDLQDTMDKFLITVQPHLDEMEFQVTKRKVEQFARKEGQQLFQMLQEHAKTKPDNWFADWWLDMAYLAYRERVPVWSSPGFVFPKQSFRNQEEMLQFATRMLMGIMDYKKQLDHQEYPPDMMGKKPVDMKQHYALFGTTRTPCPEVDQLSQFADSNYAVVMHKNHLFKMTLTQPDGSPLSPATMLWCLKSIVKEGEQLGRGPAIGLLTSQHRDKWSRDYQTLLQMDNRNQQCVDTIRKSLFMMCLDDSCDKFAGTSDSQAKSALLALHGLGAELNSGNRWFDKTLNFIVAQSGETGLTYEHSPADGVAVQALCDFVLKHIRSGAKDLKQMSECPDGDIPEALRPSRLEFVVDDNLKRCIREAEVDLQKLIDDLDMNVMHLKNFGKKVIKSHRFSPDSFFQMAIQATFYGLHRVPGAHYESGATRMYRRGRTEVIRSCSNESVRFGKALLEKDSSQNTYEAMVAAIQGHNVYAKAAVEGYGVDRLLQGLKKIATIKGVSVPDLYSDVGYLRSSHMRLSTSQISHDTEGAFVAFGPLVTDGYGVCYSLHPDALLASCSAFSSNPVTSSRQFAASLAITLDKMRQLCDKFGPEAKS